MNRKPELDTLETQIQQLDAAKVKIETERNKLATQRNAILEQEREARQTALLQLLIKQPKLLDILTPEHSRTTCSDEDPQENVDRCTRCTLLQAKQSEYWDSDYDYEFTITRRGSPL